MPSNHAFPHPRASVAAEVVLGHDTAIGPGRLAERGARLAGGLRRLGLREGDVVAVLMRNALPWVDLVVACRVAGIAYCPINWHSTPAEIAFVLHDSGARALIAHGDLLAALTPTLSGALPVLAVGPIGLPAALDYERWLAAEAPYDGPVVAPRGHMAYTSGTTGRPKGVVREPVTLDDLEAQQSAIRRVVEATFGIIPGCRCLLPAPLYHSAPSTYLQHALTMAERVVLPDRFDAAEVLAAVERHRIDALYLVPIMYVRLLRLPEATRRAHDLSSLRFVASTGAPCAPDLKRAMIDWLGPVIHETYASSEAGMVTAIGSEEALVRPGSAGRPVGDAEVRILDEQGTPCGPGEVGRIFVRQPAYPDFTYRHDDAARRAIEHDGLIGLGDLGHLDDDGYLFVSDRASDLVISGGVNIYPVEIEHRLQAIEGVFDCAVFGVPDAEYGERLHAVVETLPGVSLDADALRARLRTDLASFKVPRTIEFAILPRDDNGKIAKRRLRDVHWQGRSRRL